MTENYLKDAMGKLVRGKDGELIPLDKFDDEPVPSEERESAESYFNGLGITRLEYPPKQKA